MSKVWLILLWVGVGLGQTPATSLNGVLTGMAGQAGVIFAGQVLEISRHDDLGYVDVRFRVEEPVKGCSKLGAYVLREWVGRWLGQEDRYRLGLRYLMLLTARGPAGMSAPVYGGDGAILLTAGVIGPMLRPDGSVSEDTGPTGDSIVDLGLLQARVARDVVQAPVGQSYGDSVGSIAPFEVVPDDMPVKAPLASVLTLLRGKAGVAGGGIVAR